MLNIITLLFYPTFRPSDLSQGKAI